MYEVYNDQKDYLHDMGTANNVELKESIAKLTANNAQMKLKLATQDTKNEWYQMVVDMSISMSRGPPMEETDDMTLQSHQQ